MAHGFEKVSQKGNHHKYCKGNRIVIVTSPKKEIPIGTLQSIIKQAGLTVKILKSDKYSGCQYAEWGAIAKTHHNQL